MAACFQGEAVTLNASDTPELFKDEDGQDLPIESLTGTDKTVYLNIDLKVDPMGGKPVVPMTAVFAPDPKQLSGGDTNMLVWFHGDKHVWSKNRKGDLYLWGKSVQDYLKVDECKLREFILKSSNRNFVLVVPTLNDRTGSGKDHTAGGLLWQQGEAEAFLQQVLNGVKKYMGINATRPGNIVLAAHSGGGHILSRMAQHFTGPFNKANEVWCFDCTYWGGDPFITWAKKGHSDPRLWVYSTGGKGPRETGDPANAILTFSQTKDGATANIQVLIDDYPSAGNTSSTKYFAAAFGGSAKGHYESIDMYLTKLVDTSRKNLK
jgi:hypothetical protein